MMGLFTDGSGNQSGLGTRESIKTRIMLSKLSRDLKITTLLVQRAAIRVV